METEEKTSSGNGRGAETAEAPDHYVEKIEAAADKFADFKVARTLAGDLRDFVLDLLRTLPKTWAQMSEAEQTARAYAVSNACRKVVRDAVALLETDERTTIECLLEEVGFKPKGIVAKLGLTYADPNTRHALVDAQGKEILIVVADAAQYMGERAPAAIDKQQPELALDQAEKALAQARASQELREQVEREVDADLDRVIAAEDETEPSVGQITNLVAEREEALKDPVAAGKRAALQGFNESRNPFDHPSIESAEWLRGHAEGEQERETAVATSGKRRRSNGPDQTAASA